jgi:hypothetical protein
LEDCAVIKAIILMSALQTQPQPHGRQPHLSQRVGSCDHCVW